MRTLLDVHLGDVEIKRERQIALELSGNPRIEFDRRMRVASQIQLQRGRLDVRGRTFRIEHGIVTFTGQLIVFGEVGRASTTRAADAARPWRR